MRAHGSIEESIVLIYGQSVITNAKWSYVRVHGSIEESIVLIYGQPVIMVICEGSWLNRGVDSAHIRSVSHHGNL